MRQHAVARGARCLALFSGLVLTWQLVWLLVRPTCLDLVVAAEPLAFPRLLASVCGWVLICCVSWLALTTSVSGAALVRHGSASPSPLAERMCPRFSRELARRVVLTGCCLALGSSLASLPASADHGADHGADHRADHRADHGSLKGLEVPQRTVATRVADQADPAVPVVVRVRAGDCLWSIAADLVRQRRPGDPVGQFDVAQVDVAWRELYRRNEAVIGPEPDLIFPGTTLRVPARWAATSWKEAR